MNDSRASAGLDRLPWLADEPKVQSKATKRDLVPLSAAVVMLVAGGSFWLGSRSEAPKQPRSNPAAVTSALPQPATSPFVSVPALPQVTPSPMPDVRTAVAPEVRIAPPPRRASHRARAERIVVQPGPTQSVGPTFSPTTASPAPSLARPLPLRAWPSRVSQGAYGRLVQIGAYGSRFQAKRGWVAMVRAYPGVAHLQAVVVGSRNSHGRSFYRFQIGTTSEAHSEVLCQRMESIHLSCAIIGLPWKAKVER